MQINTVLTEGESKMTYKGKKEEKVKKMSPRTFREFAELSLKNNRQRVENEDKTEQ